MDPLHYYFYVSYPTTAMPTSEIFPAHPGGEMLVGEPLDISAKFPAGSLVCTVLSAPNGSAAQFQGGRFVPDLPGLYTWHLSNGAVSITHRRVAFPVEALEHPMIADCNFAKRAAYNEVPTIPRNEESRRLILRRIAAGAFGPFDAATFAALNAKQPIPVGLDANQFGRR